MIWEYRKLEILDLLAEQVKKYGGWVGLCTCADYLGYSYAPFPNGLINKEELMWLKTLIKENEPSSSKVIAFFTFSKKPRYYWRNGRLKPRLKWIESRKNEIEKDLYL